MDINLSDLTIVELRRLRGKVDTELRRREDSAKKDVLKQIKKIVSDAGVNLDEVLSEASTPKAAPAAKKTRRKAASPAKGKRVPVKYRNPADASAGWTGRGRKPRWVEAWLAEGKSLDDLLVK